MTNFFFDVWSDEEKCKKYFMKLFMDALAQNSENNESSELKYLTVAELSNYIHLSRPAIYGKVSKNEIPCHHIGSKILFEKNEIDKWITNK